MEFEEKSVCRLFDDNLTAAKDLLSGLPIASGHPIGFRGLTGWVFEQVVQYCLSQELRGHIGSKIEILEQVPLIGGARVDLLIGSVAIELKALGSFGGDQKYEKYRQIAHSKGWQYLYLSKQEGYAPYRKVLSDIFGTDATFYLDVEGDWQRFTNRILASL